MNVVHRDIDFLAVLLGDAPRNADNGRIGRDILNDHRIGAYVGIVADCDVAEDFGPGPDDNGIAERGMALAGFLAGSAQGHPLKKGHVIADYRGLADDNARAMVDKKPFADGSAGMNLDSGQKTAQLRNAPGKKGNIYLPQIMRDAVKDNRMESDVKKDDLNRTFR